MPSQRDWVTPPKFEPLQYRLRDAVDGPHPYQGHQKLGVQFTPDSCSFPLETSSTCVSGIGAVKTATGSLPNRGADSFAVYTWIDCTLVGLGPNEVEELKARTRRAHDNNSQTVVETVFWTGGSFNTVQHIAEDTAVTEAVAGSNAVINLQTAANILVTGAVVDVVEAIGRLEQAMAGCYGGTPLIHMPRGVATHLAANHILEKKGPRLLTPLGSIIVAAPGYPGTSPAGATPTAGTTWIYATGSVKMLQSEPTFTSGSAAELLGRDDNDTTLILEQRFTFMWDCCHFAIPVSLGGIVTGAWNSATATP